MCIRDRYRSDCPSETEKQTFSSEARPVSAMPKHWFTIESFQSGGWIFFCPYDPTQTRDKFKSRCSGRFFHFVHFWLVQCWWTTHRPCGPPLLPLPTNSLTQVVWKGSSHITLFKSIIGFLLNIPLSMYELVFLCITLASIIGFSPGHYELVGAELHIHVGESSPGPMAIVFLIACCGGGA